MGYYNQHITSWFKRFQRKIIAFERQAKKRKSAISFQGSHKDIRVLIESFEVTKMQKRVNSESSTSYNLISVENATKKKHIKN